MVGTLRNTPANDDRAFVRHSLDVRDSDYRNSSLESVVGCVYDPTGGSHGYFREIVFTRTVWENPYWRMIETVTLRPDTSPARPPRPALRASAQTDMDSFTWAPAARRAVTGRGSTSRTRAT